jgi:hypothetical protein
MFSKKAAEVLASDINDTQMNTTAKVGSHTTNGVTRYVVHITHGESENRPPAETIS